MVKLTIDEQNWLKSNHPEIIYDSERLTLKGPFTINRFYDNLPAIKAIFQIEVRLMEMKDRSEFPPTYNYDGKIVKIAKRKQMRLEDLHVYGTNALCLGLPERFSEYFPSGFELSRFFDFLSNHLYWVAYYERYNKAPWLAEEHGELARFEYYVEKEDLDGIRSIHKKITKLGISRERLRNYLESKTLINNLKRRLFK